MDPGNLPAFAAHLLAEDSAMDVLRIGPVGAIDGWKAIVLIDNAFPGKHWIGAVNSRKALAASFDRIWRTCDLYDTREFEEL